MKKETKVRLASFGAAFLALACGFWLDARLTMDHSRTQLEFVYRRALGDLTDYVSGMGNNLQKAMYAGTAPMQSAISAQLLEQSGGAKAAMAALPISQEKADRLSRFLSQVGDYALSLSRKSFAGSKPDRKDLEGLAQLREYALRLTDSLTGIQARLTAEQADIVRTVSLLNNLDDPLSTAALDKDLDPMAQEFETFPTLLYDGPFSDHISRRTPKALEGKEGISQEEAAKIAADFLRCSPDSLEFSGQGEGKLPVYAFSSEDSILSVTVQGGEPSYFRRAGAVSTAKLGYAQALKSAQDFLASLGYPAMKESYYMITDNLCTINFHTVGQTRDGQPVLCYPDLIKVTVELEEGGAVELDATGYLMNHQARSLPAPALSKEEAQAALSPYLRAESAALTVIPTPGLDEVLCWEFLCTASDGQELLCYVNAQTGGEEQLYLLQKDEHGVLTT